MLVVLLILGVVSMLGLPALNEAIGDSRLSAAAEEVVNALEFAQLTAMYSGRNTRVVFRPTQDKMTVKQFEATADFFAGGNQLLDSQVEAGTFESMQYPLNKGMEYQIIFPDDTRFQGVDMTASAIGHDNETVTFDALGVPSGGGTVTLALGGRQMVVTLDALTGKVTVSE
jgi:type II secretory pathway pseudopilin PulG